MKKQILIGLISISSILTVNAQTWNGSLTVDGNLWRNGNVGIGTSSPFSTAKFQIRTNVNQNIGVQSSTTVTGGMKLNCFNDIGNINIPFELNGSQLILKTNEIERIRINDNGNVGIGTTSPYRKLHLNENAINNNPFEGLLRIQVNSNTESLPTGLNTTKPSYGIEFVRKWNSGDERYQGGIFSYGQNNWGAGLVFQTVETNGNPISSMVINQNGNVGIGTNSPCYKLDVYGTIRTDEVIVNLIHGCDFVFKNDYKLMDLKKLEEFVKTNQHLPEIASEKEMVENGVNMKDMQMKLLQKMEELTLYMIEQNKKIEALENEIKELKSK